MFNKSEEYQKHIEPLIIELKAKCNLYQIPFFATCAISDDDKTTVYKSDVISAYGNNIALSQDYFPGFANVLNGFATVMKDASPELEIGVRQIEAIERKEEGMLDKDFE